MNPKSRVTNLDAKELTVVQTVFTLPLTAKEQLGILASLSLFYQTLHRQWQLNKNFLHVCFDLITMLFTKMLHCILQCKRFKNTNTLWICTSTIRHGVSVGLPQHCFLGLSQYIHTAVVAPPLFTRGIDIIIVVVVSGGGVGDTLRSCVGELLDV